MFNKITTISIFIIFTIYFSLPISTSAFWWFGQKKAETPVVQNQITNENIQLDEKAKINAEAKYKLWADGFEKKKIESIIVNSNKFIFTVPELNYIAELESTKMKNSVISNVTLSKDNDTLNIKANIHKIINGQLSFNSKVINVENKIRLDISNVKLYGFPIPANLISGKINEALDNYFSFLYKDSRYQGFTFTTENNSIQLKPEFKK